jgi:transposase InsO family protein
VHPAKPKVGLRTTRADEMWQIDTTVIRLLDGTRAYVHAVIDNFSRRILAWRVADTFAPVNSVAVLLDARRGAPPSDTTELSPRTFCTFRARVVVSPKTVSRRRRPQCF